MNEMKCSMINLKGSQNCFNSRDLKNVQLLSKGMAMETNLIRKSSHECSLIPHFKEDQININHLINFKITSLQH